MRKLESSEENLEKIIEEFVGFENQLYPVQEFNKNLNKNLNKTLEGMTEVDKILKNIINH